MPVPTAAAPVNVSALPTAYPVPATAVTNDVTPNATFGPLVCPPEAAPNVNTQALEFCNCVDVNVITISCVEAKAPVPIAPLFKSAVEIVIVLPAT